MVKPLKCHEALERVEDPAETPVTLAECKAHMRVDFSDDDAYITALLNAAVSYLDGQGVLGKAMVTQKWRQYVGQSPSIVSLSVLPVQSVTEVGYYDASGVEQTATLSDFDVFGNGQATTVQPKSGASWPVAQDRSDAIWIEYEAGYGDAADAPDALKQAIKMIVAYWYENREAVSAQSMKEVPIGITALINTQRGCWYG
jgi:uncharacterized phiE125 gp8 family phage protein